MLDYHPILRLREMDAKRRATIGALLYLDLFMLIVFLCFFAPFYYSLVNPPEFLPSLDQTTGQTIQAEVRPSVDQTTGQTSNNPQQIRGAQTQSSNVTLRNIEAPIGLRAEATRACASVGFKSLDCRNIILAISYHETQGWTDFSGDSGCSTGWVHINRCVHTHITNAATMDAAFAFAWTAQRLKAFGYPTYRTQAIQCHNGCYANNGYANQRIKPLVERFAL